MHNQNKTSNKTLKKIIGFNNGASPTPHNSRPKGQGICSYCCGAIKKHVKMIVTISLISVFLFIALWQGLFVRKYTIESKKINVPIKIVLLADLHSTYFGKNQKKLIKAIERENPDVVLLAGDIADDVVPHGGTIDLLASIGTNYPCFYVTGNHEIWSDDTDDLIKMIRSHGVTVLEGSTEIIEINGQKMQISGIDDPVINTYNENKIWQNQFDKCEDDIDENIYSVLLSHRPEKVQLYTNSSFDLVVSGHAHGGQMRIPFLVNGLYVPNQGFFPKYAGGFYSLGTTSMVVSRGLVRNSVPRVFNPPELVVISLQ